MWLGAFSSLIAILVASVALAGGVAQVGGGSIPIAAAVTLPAADETFTIESYLSSVTSSSVIISVLPDDAFDLRVNYGPTTRMGTRTTAVTTVADTREDIELTGLDAGTIYFYQVETKATSEFYWGAQKRNHFRTLRTASGDIWKFGIGSDTHASTRWQNANCGDEDDPDWTYWYSFQRTALNAAGAGLDFWLDLGDTAMTHNGAPPTQVCSIGAEEMVKGTIDAVEANTTGQRQAELDWQVTLVGGGDAAWGYQMALASLPWFFACGNHDGCQPNWGDEYGSGRYYIGEGSIVDTTPTSLAAQKLIWPNPYDTYANGQADGRYFGFESGDVAFYLLDPYIATIGSYDGNLPDDVTEWEFGSTQKSWFSSRLAAQTETWTIVALHSWPGGIDGIRISGYQYGRGSARSTDDGLITGTFNNSDAVWLFNLLAGRGNAIVVLGHDHSSNATEKLDSNGNGTGVYFIKNGPSAGVTTGYSLHFLLEENFDNNETVFASAGPATVECNSTANTFTCAACNFITSGFTDDNILDATGFAGSADGFYKILSVAKTVITVATGQGNEANLCDDSGDGDEILEMRISDVYEDGAAGGWSPGWTRVTVGGTSSLVFDFILSGVDEDDTDDGTVDWTYTVEAE